jgi:aspartate racemase
MGPLATAVFYRLVVLNTVARRDQDHIPLIVDSHAQIPDRTAFLLGEGDDPRPALREAAYRLAEAGADLLVMPCNTANAFASDVESAAGRPLVPWLETAVAAACGDRKASDTVRCGLLGTDGTLRTGLYRAAFAERGVEVLEPDKRDQASVMDAIYADDGVKASGSASPERRDALVVTARNLVERGANVLLLACTELPLAIPADDPAWPARTVDPALEVARLTILRAGARLRPIPVPA